MKIVVLDGYGLNPGDLNWDWLNELGDVKIYDRTSPAELIEHARGAEVLFTNKTVLDGKALRELPGLRYIGVLATGYNVVDVDVAHESGVTVTNIPAYSTDSVAQMVFALLLAMTNRVEHYASRNRTGRWNDNPDFCYWDYPLTELAGKTFGIVGLGNIGRAVARIALAFGMKVQAYTSKPQTDLPEGIEKVELATLFSTSDVVSLHCPLTETTRNLVDKERLALMKTSAILINTGRGPLVDEAAVAESLSAGMLAGFGADVLSSEPPSADNPLLSAPNAYITPHIAWATVEARRRLMDICEGNLKAFLSGSPRNVV